MKSRKPITAAVVAMASMALMLAGCSSTAGDDADSGGGSTVSAAAQAALNDAYAGIGSDLSDLAAVKPKAGVKFYVISCGEMLPSCAFGSAAMKAAAEAAGWDATIADGKLNPDGFVAAVRQAIAGGATAMSVIGISCSSAQAAFAEAAAAGVTVIGNAGADDCSPKVWSGNRQWMPDTTMKDYWEACGKLQADYAWGKTNGDVKAVMADFTSETWGQWIQDGFNSRLAELGSGEVVASVSVSNPEVVDGSFVQKFTSAALAHPEANVLLVPNDGWLTNGLSASLVAAGLSDRLVVISRGGDAAALDMIRAGGGGFTATVGTAVDWGAWGAVDTAIRVLAGVTPVPTGDMVQIVDADHNMPVSGFYAPPVDFTAAYSKAWGASK